MSIKKKLKKAALFSVPVVGALFAAQFYLLHELPKHLKTGEEYLDSIGVDPNIASQLSDQNIKVIERDTLGNALMFLKFPVEALEVHEIMNDPVYAAADRRPSFHDECHVILPSEELKAKTLIAHLAGVEEDQINTVKISDKEAKLAVIFHEFRHCHSENHTQEISNEADSDLHALKAVTELTGSWETYKTFMYARAIGEIYGPYETSQTLDAHIHGYPAPNNEQIQATAQATFNQMSIYLDLDDFSKWAEGNYHEINITGIHHAFNKIANSNIFNYTQEVRNRASLYTEAIQYFDIPLESNYDKQEDYTPTS